MKIANSIGTFLVRCDDYSGERAHADCQCCGWSCYHEEQLHLYEFAALESKRINDKLDMDLLVKQKPFREEKEGTMINDLDSDDEGDAAPAKHKYTEFLGGDDGDDVSEHDDTDGDVSVTRIASVKLLLEQNKAMLRRDNEVERASAPGRHKESDVVMKALATTFRKVLEKEMPKRQRRDMNVVCRFTLLLGDAKTYQNCVAKEYRTGDKATLADEEMAVIFQAMRTTNQRIEEEACMLVTLADALKGPGWVARKLMKECEQECSGFSFNEEQVWVIALQIWPLEQAFRAHLQGQHPSSVTVSYTHLTLPTKRIV